ncbi:hypothetical protein DDP54_10475 [Cellulomonas sp. WB94]|uniref:hypothetical protein n=1 Tax=Cellulomonas sp. WB94 TaxID=2173174 RepID=UPI000D56B503|nr:hypothetical protein [Cellulomonas sp. WB94]PVU83349.1 hypothetical protein DDP54_10475 [Cellulomonas sp. WB94]
MSKSTNRRKSIAIALAVLGVAGLSLASAAQLNLTGSNTVQSGTLALTADCQTTTIPVTFSAPARTGATFGSDTVTLSKIDAACADGKHKYKVALLGDLNAVILDGVETSLASGATSISIPLSAGQDNAIKTVALTIYS